MPDWLPIEANTVAEAWWEQCQADREWPGTFIEAFMVGYVAGYERRGRRRKVDGSEEV